MNKWIVVINQDKGMGRMEFNDGTALLDGMRAVIEAAQFWNMERFTQWVRNAKVGQWVEIRDINNYVRVLVIRSSDPKGWWV